MQKTEKKSRGIQVKKGVNDLKTRYKNIAKEWDYVSNGYLEPSDVCAKSNKKAYWICSKCGHHYYARIANRTANGTGCPECAKINRKHKQSPNRSWIETKVFTILQKIFRKVERQKRFRDCRGSNFGILAYDFYVPQLRLLLEYNGKEHYEPIAFSTATREERINNYVIRLEHDEIKRKYAESHGLKFIEIPYQYKNETEILEFVNEKMNCLLESSV